MLARDEDYDPHAWAYHAASLEWATPTLSEAGFAATARRLEGEVGAAISAQVRERHIDLLVMGAYGRSRIHQLVVGTTTTAMLRNCQIPVLLLR